MGTGIRLRKLWRLKLGMLVSLLLALLAATWSVQTISLSPPGLSPRKLEMATAVTHVLVDTPNSTMIDLRQDTYSVDGLKNRTILLGNVIASSTVAEKIARRAKVPAELLRVQAPLTRSQSSPPVDSQNARRTSDILKSAEQYRLNIKVNATVPVIDIYAQSPSAESAEAMANAAFDELQIYLTELAASQHTPAKDQIRLVQLGRASGLVINDGVKWQVALLTFLATFLACAATVTFLARVRAGWRQAALSERGESAPSTA